MRTILSNEVAIRQAQSADGKIVLSIIKSGSHFRFVEESRLAHVASNGLESYEYPAETYRSGLYATLHEAERDARALARGLTEFGQS